MRAVLVSLFSPLLVATVHASVTIYTQVTFGTGTATSAVQPLVSYPAHNDQAFAQPPAPPTTTPGAFVVQLQSAPLPNLSKPVQGNHMGLSVELSIADQVVGQNGSVINPTFLNVLENIRVRNNEVKVRVGGNTQEKAVFFPNGLPGGQTITKDRSNVHGPTNTPTIDVGIDLIYALANISALTETYWFLGIPFNDTSNPRLQIGDASEAILGKYLLGFQLGNEPDLYAIHGLRDPDYNQTDYVNDIEIMLNAIGSDSAFTNKTNMMGPSVCCLWTTEQVFDAGFSSIFDQSYSWFAAEHYPNNNCNSSNQTFTVDEAFGLYVGHSTVTNTVGGYVSDVQLAEQHNKPYVMLETNTASCAGFFGTSDSFLAALWTLDYELAMVSINTTAAMFHLGGQNAVYNPITPPPGIAAKRGYGWTMGPVLYSAIMVAEALGSTGTAQVADLQINGNNDNMAGYVIYENGAPAKVVLINYVNDPTGNSDYTAQLAIDGSGLNLPNASPSQVFVRRLRSHSNSTADHVPFYYANQTFGEVLSSNGILQGNQFTETISCDPTNNLCSVTVPAASAALVFLTPQAEAGAINTAEARTFSTTVTTVQVKNTASINPSVLATSNGYGGLNNQIGSTSFGSSDATGLRGLLSGALVTAVCLLAGASAVLRLLS